MNNSMNIYEYPEAKGIVVSGDIHGAYTDLVFKACMSYSLRDTLVIVAGDCGFGFYRPGYYKDLYKKCLRRLQKFNNWIVFVRGNHDNPAYFDGLVVDYDRWRAVPDYSILKACGHTILCVGGAISVDRLLRKYENYIDFGDGKLNPFVYWPDERSVYDESKLEAVGRMCAVNTVISHTAPSFCEKLSRTDIQGWIAKDEDLLDDLKAERATMNKILAYLKEKGHPLRQWFYGHFHQSWHSEIEGVRYNLLDCMELREIR